jgi:hypothetical protein
VHGARSVSVDDMGRLADAPAAPLSDLVDPDKFKGLDGAHDVSEGAPRIGISLGEGTEGRAGLP